MTALIIGGMVVAYVVITLITARIFEVDEIKHGRSDPEGSLLFGLFWPLLLPFGICWYAWEGGKELISMPTRQQRRSAKLNKRREDMEQCLKDVERLERELGVGP